MKLYKVIDILIKKATIKICSCYYKSAYMHFLYFKMAPYMNFYDIVNCLKVQILHEDSVKMTDDALSFSSNSLRQTKNIANKITPFLKTHPCLTISGNLGSGKTTLTGYIINNLAKNSSKIQSPTFNIINIYEPSFGKIFHMDLYRIKDTNELFELGFPDIFYQGICIIEWPEIAKNLLPKKRIEINISLDSKNTRDITIKIVDEKNIT